MQFPSAAPERVFSSLENYLRKSTVGQGRAMENYIESLTFIFYVSTMVHDNSDAF